MLGVVVSDSLVAVVVEGTSSRIPLVAMVAQKQSPRLNKARETGYFEHERSAHEKRCKCAKTSLLRSQLRCGCVDVERKSDVTRCS